MSEQTPRDAAPDDAHQYDEELANPPATPEVQPVSPEELKAGAAERSRQRPLLQKILAVFQKERGAYRELIINS